MIDKDKKAALLYIEILKLYKEFEKYLPPEIEILEKYNEIHKASAEFCEVMMIYSVKKTKEDKEKCLN